MSCPPKSILPKGTLMPNSGNQSKAMRQSQTIQQNNSCGMYGIQAGATGATGPAGKDGNTVGLARVLINGNHAGFNDIIMDQQHIRQVGSIGNTFRPLSINAPRGIELSGTVGNKGQIFTSNGSGEPYWLDVSAIGAPSLSNVLGVGNDAEHDIIMNEYRIREAASIGNTTTFDIIANTIDLKTQKVQINGDPGSTNQVFAVNSTGNPVWSDVSSLYTPTLSQVLNKGNVASKPIDMSGNNIINVPVLTNTNTLEISANIVSLYAPHGIQLSGDTGTAGQVFTSNGSEQPTWEDVSDLIYYSDTQNIFLVKQGQTGGSVSGSNNTAVGYNALYDTTGSQNTAIGNASLYNSNGTNNIAIGNSAGYSNTGDNNIFIGADLSGVSNNIILGSTQTDTTIYSNTITLSNQNNQPTLLTIEGSGNAIHFTSGTYEYDVQMNTVTGGSTGDGTLTIIAGSTIIDSNVDMSENNIFKVSSIGNTGTFDISANSISLYATAGIQLSGDTGTAGQVFTSNASGQPTWSDVSDLYAPSLSDVLNNGNVASKPIDMSGNSITNVSSIGNTGTFDISANSISLYATAGIELNGDTGTAGQVFTSNASGQPTWSDVSDLYAPSLSDVLNNGNVASKPIDMSGNSITNVSSIGNTGPFEISANSISLYATAGIELSNGVGTSGYIFTSNGNAQPTWEPGSSSDVSLVDVLAVGNVAGSRGIDMSNNDISGISNVGTDTVTFEYTALPSFSSNKLGGQLTGASNETSVPIVANTSTNIVPTNMNNITITAGIWLITYDVSFSFSGNILNDSGSFSVGIGTSTTIDFAMSSRQLYLSTIYSYTAASACGVYSTASSDTLYLNIFYDAFGSPTLTNYINNLYATRIA